MVSTPYGRRHPYDPQPQMLCLRCWHTNTRTHRGVPALCIDNTAAQHGPFRNTGSRTLHTECMYMSALHAWLYTSCFLKLHTPVGLFLLLAVVEMSHIAAVFNEAPPERKVTECSTARLFNNEDMPKRCCEVGQECDPDQGHIIITVWGYSLQGNPFGPQKNLEICS